ncbi:nicotinate phosphoribosyltransferase [Stetteria hydrogenophila]
MGEPRLYAASPDEIREGGTADIYFSRAVEAIKHLGLEDVRVRAEVHAYSLPRGYEWAVFAGLEEALALLKGRPVTVYALPEGTLFKRKEPLMLIEGRYVDFALLETALLGVLRFSTSIATKAARVKAAAGGKTVLFFGLRALHPAVAPAADRAAYIGGVDGVSGLAAGRYLGVKPTGTMPHALIIVVGDQVKAWKAFAERFAGETPVIALADTFYDERVESLMAARALGEELAGVRLDTPGSRRGNMRDIVEEVRWTLDLHGYKHVKIFVSGGIDEDTIAELRDVADGFGVGTSIAAPPSVDISMDIVEVDRGDGWVPVAKRGKLPGAKQLYRCRVLEDYVLPWGSEAPKCPGGEARPMLVKYLDRGVLVRELPGVVEIRRYVLEQLREAGVLEGDVNP